MKHINSDPRINVILEFMADIDKHNNFLFERSIINKTKYKDKKWYDFAPSYTTTWGAAYVKLSRGFWTLPIKRQAAILVHETVHQGQYLQYGKLGFLKEYILEHFKKGYLKNNFENAARNIEAEFMRLT
jgi:hypothetical protein